MDFRFAACELASLDALKSEVLCLFTFSDERPLRGVAGLVDWRLCGRISDLLERGLMRGAEGEALLMPPPERRLTTERLLWLGAGARGEVDEARFRSLMGALFERLLGLRVRSAAVALPHASLGLAPDRAIDALLEASLAASAEAQLDELVVVDTAEAQRAMEPRIERARRRALVDV